MAHLPLNMRSCAVIDHSTDIQPNTTVRLLDKHIKNNNINIIIIIIIIIIIMYESQHSVIICKTRLILISHI